MKKTLGIVGGMGPLATVELFRLIVENTKSDNDQNHIHILIDNNTSIPDRTAYIIGNGASPVPEIVRSAKKLGEMGATILLIPCNTSHYFYNEIYNCTGIEIINMIEETIKMLYLIGNRSVGILATTGTLRGKLYQEGLSKYGIKAIVPSDDEQAETMKFIYEGVKAGNKNYDTIPMQNTIQSMMDQGTENIILGCTELSVGFRERGLCIKCVDSLKVLSNTAILKAGYKIRSDYVGL